MNFPESPRTKYEKNPLDEVICQLRFAPILRIQATEPHEFQEKIRGEYPGYEAQAPESDVPIEVERLLRQAGREFRAPKTHHFLNEAGTWKVSLARDFLALSTSDYRDWREFRQRLQSVISAFCEIYEPSQIRRTGLRYRDVIRRSRLGLNSRTWADLLRASASGELADENVGSMVSGRVVNLFLNLIGGSRCKITHGIVEEAPAEVAGAEPEDCYLIDADFFSEESMEVSDAQARLDEFNAVAGRAFRWFISDELHDALRPGATYGE